MGASGVAPALAGKRREGGMDRFFQSIERSLDTANWYAALAVALMVPDVCARMEHGKTSGKRYKEWFDKYVKPRYTGTLPVLGEHVFLTGGDCYAFRCSLLHEGTEDISDQQAKEVLERFRFELPDQNNNVRHCCQEDKVLILQVRHFCRDIINGAKSWLRDMAGKADVAQRLTTLINIHASVPRL
jgi:hypothetical protein